MPKPPKQSAHAQLDQLRRDAADERMKARDAGVALDTAQANVDEADRALVDAYALEDAKLAGQRRTELPNAEADVTDLRHRVAAAGLRVQRAQRQLDEFMRTHARDLLEEREPNARTVAAELTASVHHTLKLAKAYVAERQAQDQLVAAVPGASPRSDGAAPAHPWEAQLQALARVVNEVGEVPAPLPSWRGIEHLRQQDELNQHRTATSNVAVLNSEE